MGICNDSSVTFLKSIGYNVVRHPNAGIQPLDLLGVQDNEIMYLGPLNLLITNPPGPLPKITRDVVAAEINGQVSSAMKFGLGVNILGALIGAMGGNLGVGTNYTDARQMQFSYSDVLNDYAVPLEVGNYLRNADVDARNLVLKQYVFGRGELYIIIKTAKSNKLSVLFQKNTGVAANIDIPIIQSVAGGNLKVDTSAATNGRIVFSGSQNLIFAFQAFQIGVENGVLSMTSVEAGDVAFAVEQGDSVQPTIINQKGLLQLKLN